MALRGEGRGPRILLFACLIMFAVCGVASAASTAAWGETSSMVGLPVSYTWDTGKVAVNATIVIFDPASAEHYNSTNKPASGTGTETPDIVGTWTVHLYNNTMQSLATDTVSITARPVFQDITDMVDDLVIVMGSLVNLVVAAIPAIVVFSLFLFLVSMLYLIQSKL